VGELGLEPVVRAAEQRRRPDEDMHEGRVLEVGRDHGPPLAEEAHLVDLRAPLVVVRPQRPAAGLAVGEDRPAVPRREQLVGVLAELGHHVVIEPAVADRQRHHEHGRHHAPPPRAHVGARRARSVPSPEDREEQQRQAERPQHDPRRGPAPGGRRERARRDRRRGLDPRAPAQLEARGVGASLPPAVGAVRLWVRGPADPQVVIAGRERVLGRVALAVDPDLRPCVGVRREVHRPPRRDAERGAQGHVDLRQPLGPREPIEGPALDHARQRPVRVREARPVLGGAGEHVPLEVDLVVPGRAVAVAQVAVGEREQGQADRGDARRRGDRPPPPRAI